jgi:hypothetical protein
VLGAAGQVIFHLLAAVGATRAPWPVVVVVACLPVITLGFGAALTHLLRAVTEEEPELSPTLCDDEDPVPDTPETVPAGVPDFSGLNGHRAKAERLFAGDIETGQVPGIRRIRDALHVGQPKAKLVQAYLKTLSASQ